MGADLSEIGPLVAFVACLLLVYVVVGFLLGGLLRRRGPRSRVSPLAEGLDASPPAEDENHDLGDPPQ
jgi:hypothetical protein